MPQNRTNSGKQISVFNLLSGKHWKVPILFKVTDVAGFRGHQLMDIHLATAVFQVDTTNDGLSKGFCL